MTVFAIIGMERTLGELTAKVDRLISEIKGHSEKIDGVRVRLAWVAGGAAVVDFLVALA